LGIGDWAQSPIPNPQSPIPIAFNLIKKTLIKFYNIILLYVLNFIYINYIEINKNNYNKIEKKK